MQSFTTLLTLVTALASLTVTNAHPGHAPEIRSDEEQHVHIKRTAIASKCAAQARAMRESRKLARRGLTKRQGQTDPISVPEHAQELQNTTCVLAPEVTEGPYYIRDEYVRPDLRENQPGVELVLDIGLLDINTCEPLSNAFVEIWACNSTGYYGAAKGIVELTTIYPGWYTGRTVHIHTMIHTNYTVQQNGTLASGEGKLIHVGQVFFDDDLTTEVGTKAPYNTTTQPRITNSEDNIFLSENAAGNNALAEHALLGNGVEGGILSYITIGVDTAASYQVGNPNVQPK